MNSIAPLQVSLVFDFVPPWLASLVIFAGAVALIYSLGKNLLDIRIFSKDRLKSTISFSAGMFLLLVPAFQRFSTPATFGLFLLGRWVQGTTTIHTVNRIIFKGQFAVVEGKRRLQSKSKRSRRSSSYTETITSIVSAVFSRNKIAYLGAAYILTLVALWLGAIVITEGALVQSVGYDLRLIWTMVVLISSLLSLLYSFSKLSTTADMLSAGTIGGFILLIVGPEVYNFAFGLDLLSLVLGGIVYFGAIVWGAFRSLVISDFVR